MDWINTPTLPINEGIGEGEITPLFCMLDWCFIYEDCLIKGSGPVCPSKGSGSD